LQDKALSPKIGTLGVVSLALAIASVFVSGVPGIFVAVFAVLAGFLGNRRKERFSTAGMIIGGLVLIFLNFQNMGLLPASKNSRNVAHFTRSLQYSDKVFHLHKQMRSAATSEEMLKIRQEILDTLNKGIQEARAVDVVLFERRIPGFTQHYQGEFIKGMEYLKDGYASSDKLVKLKGTALLLKWAKWLKGQKKAFRKQQQSEKPSLFEAVTGN